MSTDGEMMLLVRLQIKQSLLFSNKHVDTHYI